ncbi:MAG: AMP-binding protein [Bacteroidaceae bacterium]|nr:AMP-binding protein [Bacteroidaceae bacterium]
MSKYTNKNYVALFEASVKKNWENEALSDYKGETYTYGALAREIGKLHILFQEIGIAPGDKIAICSRNRATWAIAFMSIVTYGAVAVPILHEFKSEQIHNIVNHSEARLLFIGDKAWSAINPDAIANVKTIISLFGFKPLRVEDQHINEVCDKLDALFDVRYPAFSPADIHYHPFRADGEDLIILNYTSGSTGKSKGVMIPNRAIWSNVQFVIDEVGAIITPGSVVSLLPMAHMYGLAFEVLAELALGMHTYFLTRNPSPSIIFHAFAEVKPTFMVAVPLIIEKVMQKTVLPKLQDMKMKILLKLPVISGKVKDRISSRIEAAFGGRFFEVIIGGAAFNRDVETILHNIKFRYTVGYGATECAPLITYAHYYETKLASSGKAVARMQVRIDSPDPHHIVGEILCKGDNVMLGYFKNEEETAKVIDKDGWYHTGDLGIIDEDGYLFISGRSKNMLLSANGQNIYPEEIEDRLNSVPLIAESIVIQSKKDNRLCALLYLDQDEVTASGLDQTRLQEKLENIRKEINHDLPAYEQIATFKLYDHEFEKTPKHSIKRFLYFDEDV